MWQASVRVQMALLARPWEAEGELRWVRDAGGRRLIGRELPAIEPEVVDLGERTPVRR